MLGRFESSELLLQIKLLLAFKQLPSNSADKRLRDFWPASLDLQAENLRRAGCQWHRTDMQRVSMCINVFPCMSRLRVHKVCCGLWSGLFCTFGALRDCFPASGL
ncbi:unnamed protein product [Polarella glacialis]|uniref:Uncharacterized protein n=1 Tax=Polarella glacialis TaxID=89957 RepID=A0A813JHF4_POLGL|nr:unnamed protein product [Polarella glacialis]